eukprot:11198893-Lingulodinium_polyedra.AAC.1
MANQRRWPRMRLNPPTIAPAATQPPGCSPPLLSADWPAGALPADLLGAPPGRGRRWANALPPGRSAA